MLLKKTGENTPERIKRQSQSKNNTTNVQRHNNAKNNCYITVVDVMGDGSNIWCCKEQCCIGTWNVKSMNQGKLGVVKQEMARVNIDILGISELKWTGKGKFDSHDHYIWIIIIHYIWIYCGQESLRRNGVVHIVNKRVWSPVLGCNLKNDRMISVFSKANHSISQ